MLDEHSLALHYQAICNTLFLVVLLFHSLKAKTSPALDIEFHASVPTEISNLHLALLQTTIDV